MRLIATLVLASLVAWPGMAGPQDMLVLMQRITALAKEGKYGDAVGLARKLVNEAERSAGRQSPVTAMTLVVLAQVLQAQGGTAEAEAVLKRALVIREKALGPDHPDVAAVLSTLGQIELNQNRLTEAERDIARAVAIDEGALGRSHLTTALALMPLGNLRHLQLREAEALEAFNRALAVFKATPGQAEMMVPVALNNIAEVEKAQGHLQAAENKYQEALALQEKQHGRDSLYVTATLNNLGELRRMQGRLAEAEQAARRALAIREQAQGPDHPDVAASLNNLALALTRQGRAAETEGLLVRALAIQEKAFGPGHPNVAIALNNLADTYSHLGRKTEAEQLLRRSLAIREKSLGPSHLDVAIALDNLTALLFDDTRYGDAEPLARRSLAIREVVLGQLHPLVANSLNNLAVILDGTGRGQEAEPLLKRALDIRVQTLGETHPDVAVSLANLGAHAEDLRDWRQAHDAFARAVAIATARSGAGQDADQTGAAVRLRDDAEPFPGLIVSAFHLAATSASAEVAALRSEAFEAAQRLGDDQAARAIAGMSARIAAGSDALAARVRERQDLSGQADAIDRLLLTLMSQSDNARNLQAEQGLRAQAADITAKITELDRQIAAQFPGYSSLVARTPVSIADVQKQLGANDALLLFTTSERFTFVWTITRSVVHWHAAPLGAKQVAETVGALRCGLDESAWYDKAQACAQRLGLQHEPAPGDPLPFDLDRAYTLEQALLGPVAREIAGKELILVPSGPLATLPFEVLLTEKPTPGMDLAKAPWLVKSFATTVLPSVSSLGALRQLAQRSRATKPFAGFGNPLLDGDGRSTEAVTRARQARLLQSCSEIAGTRNDQVAERGLRSLVALSGGTADLAQLKGQMPLPETALELCAVAASFRPKGDVYLGSQATEANIKALSDSGRLAAYRVLHFATHGALAGQVRGAIEPGLLLTPPAAATAADDGYLSSSEISALRLDADWVVLSACNTAGGEGPGAEAFSGLARAFFYAGSRALLVSHWPVASEAAVVLTTGINEVTTAHPEIGRAEALRRSIVSLIAKGGADARPSTWAPFVLVGNGGA